MRRSRSFYFERGALVGVVIGLAVALVEKEPWAMIPLTLFVIVYVLTMGNAQEDDGGDSDGRR